MSVHPEIRTGGSRLGGPVISGLIEGRLRLEPLHRPSTACSRLPVLGPQYDRLKRSVPPLIVYEVTRKVYVVPAVAVNATRDCGLPLSSLHAPDTGTSTPHEPV